MPHPRLRQLSDTLLVPQWIMSCLVVMWSRGVGPDGAAGGEDHRRGLALPVRKDPTTIAETMSASSSKPSAPAGLYHMGR
ncbi:MAG: hypothetical protein JWR24_297 [Actinoallomurus sp.]|nr:hypothetical protein [Actinoallomurus sp.]